MTTNFVPLHVHSHYSLLDGLAKIDELVNQAKKYGYESMALTDHGVMYGSLEFYQKARAAGIKPIIGCEVYVAPRSMTDRTPKIDTSPYHLILLAKNNIGYKNLVYLVTQGHLNGYYYKPRIDKDILKEHAGGLIASTSCLQGEIPRLILSGKLDKAKECIKFHQEIFGKDGYYLEMQCHPEIPAQGKVNKALAKLSRETGAPLIATHDTHYLRPDDNEAHELLLAIQTGKDIDDAKRLSMGGSDFSFPPREFFLANFKEYPEVFENSVKIAQMCNVELELGKLILPNFAVPKKYTNSLDYLKDLAEQGFEKRYPNPTEEAKKRFHYELSVIEKTNFVDYFLIVADFVNWAKDQGILVGPGRGSAAGSIISYCLNITDIEPLRYKLLFERFLNPSRIAPPDIDMDFPDDRRDEVLSYVRQKYGSDHVAQIITFGVMKARMAIRDCGRAMGMAYQDVDRLAKLIPFGFDIKQTLEKIADFRNLYQQDPKIKKLIDMTKKLEGVARHASIHAAGVVISREPLINYLPLQHGPRGGEEVITQYSMYDVETIGLLKMDFLGLANLTVIKNAIRIIKKTQNTEIDLLNLPLDDKKTFTLVASGHTTGVFQLESDGMKRYLKELKPSKIEDIIAMVALYRPGPMELIPDYIAGKHGKKKITYLHPKLEPILKDTYGVAVFQEQLMQIAQAIAGFSLGEADVLRKAIGKKKKSLLMEQKKKFIEGVVKNKVQKSTAEKLFSFIEPFARYGFNKSHAASYAMISYQTAYLKAHFPSEFMAALLTSDFQNLDRIAIEVAECEHMKTKVLPPNINHSFVEFGVIKETGDITFGLSAIKNVGLGAAEAITNEREKSGLYKSFEDFLERLGPEVINKKVIESLAKAGAIDIFLERNQALASIEQILKFSSSLAKEKTSGQISLFAEVPLSSSAAKLSLTNVEPVGKRQRLAWEKELLGIYLSEHPLAEFQPILEKNSRAISSLEQNEVGSQITVAGIITNVKKIITKSGEPMLFVHLEDTTASTEIIVFPKTLKKNFFVWQADNLVFVKGRLDAKDGVLKIIADEANEIEKQLSLTKKLNEPAQYTEPKLSDATNKSLVINLKGSADKTSLEKIKKALSQYLGKSPVILRLPQDGEYKQIKTKITVFIDDKLLEVLTEILGPDRIEIQ